MDFYPEDEPIFWLLFTELCRSVGKRPCAVVTAIGYTKASASAWKRGVVPRKPAIEKLAAYFHVSPLYLCMSGRKLNEITRATLARIRADQENSPAFFSLSPAENAD